MIRLSLEPGIAHPIMPVGLDVRVWRWFDLLTGRGDLLEAPITLPVVSAPYIARMRGCGRGYAVIALTVITGAAAPLPIDENLEGPPAWHLVLFLHAKSRNLLEAVVAGPALLAGAGVRIGWNVAMGLLSVAASQPPRRANKYHSMER